MLTITLICVGKLKEPHYAAAADEYLKRLRPYCRTELRQVPEAPLREAPSPAEVERALAAEASGMKIPRGTCLIPLCIEGETLSSVEFSALLQKLQNSGHSHLCFVIGGSNGLSEDLKKQAWFRLSMSKMTFPHHLARVMFLEQLYRAFNLLEGGKYHK